MTTPHPTKSDVEPELGPDGKEWAKTAAGYAHVEIAAAKADGFHGAAPWFYGHALRKAFVAGAEWQEQRPLVPERWTVPISKDGNYVFIDGPGDVELDHDGKMRKHLGAIVDAWEALPGGRSRPTPKIGDFP